MQARYVHTNLIAEDWQKLAEFYIAVFGCTIVPPERDYSGATLEAITGLPGAHLRGVHLHLPGYEEAGPTLEIFTYARMETRPAVGLNRPSFAHIAFEVDDITQAYQAIVEHGGAPLGEVATLRTNDGAKVTLCYMRDPEGNILEIQSWSR